MASSRRSTTCSTSIADSAWISAAASSSSAAASWRSTPRARRSASDASPMSMAGGRGLRRRNRLEPEGSARLRSRGHPRRRHGSHHRLARIARRKCPCCRTTQGHEEFEETRKEGVTFLPRRGPKRFLGVDRLMGVELRAVQAVFDDTGRFAPGLRRRRRHRRSRRSPACWPSASRPDLSFLTPADGVALNRRRDDQGRCADAGDVRARHLRRRRCGVRAAQSDRGGRQRQARRRLHPSLSRRPSRASSWPNSRSRSCRSRTTG